MNKTSLFLYFLISSILMWFPIDFFAHEIVGLYPETVAYYVAKTVVMLITSLAVYSVYRRVKNGTLVEFAIISGILAAIMFGFYYYIILYYIYPSTMPQLSPAGSLVTNLLGLHKPILPLTNTVLEEFTVVHVVSNILGAFVAGLIFLRKKFRIY